MSHERPDREDPPRGDCGFECGAAVGTWLMGTAVLLVLLLGAIDDHCHVRCWLEEVVDALADLPEIAVDGFPETLFVYVIGLAITSPVLASALAAIRTPTWLTGDVPQIDLAGLSPGLRGLVADARALRIALERPDEAMLLEVWNWQRRFEQLDEGDRRELEHLGIGDPGIAERLRGISAMPERRLLRFGASRRLQRRMRELARSLESFEQRVLRSHALFRGPFR